jgi:hypothetical protein
VTQVSGAYPTHAVVPMHYDGGGPVLYSLAFFAGFVDLLAAAVLVVAEGLDAVLFENVAGLYAGGDGSEEPPGGEVLRAQVALDVDLAFVLLQHALDFFRVEIVMHECAVEVQGGDELLRPGLLDLLQGLARYVDDVAGADGHDVEVVEDRVGVEWRAAAVGAGPEDDIGVQLVAFQPELGKVQVEAGENPDSAEVRVKDLHAVSAAMHALTPEYEDLAIVAGDLSLAVDQDSGVVLPVARLLADGTDHVHTVLLSQLSYGLRRRPRDRLGLRPAELLGQAGDVHAVLARRLQMVQGHRELLIVLPIEPDTNGRHFDLPARQFSPVELRDIGAEGR